MNDQIAVFDQGNRRSILVRYFVYDVALHGCGYVCVQCVCVCGGGGGGGACVRVYVGCVYTYLLI